jgi:hypothetical protein
MNPRWVLIRRLRGPVFLLTFGLTALLHQWGVLSFGQSWPLYLIVAGILTLLERAAANSVPFDPNAGYTQQGYPGYPTQPYPPQYPAPAPSYTPVNQQPGSSIVPAGPTDITPEGRR